MVLIDIQCGLPTLAMVRTASLHARLALKGPRHPRGRTSPQTGGQFSSAALGALCPPHTLPPPPGWAIGGKQAEKEPGTGAQGFWPAGGLGLTTHPPPASRPGTFPGRAGRGAQAWPHSGKGHPAKATRSSVALSAKRKSGRRFQATIKHQGGRVPRPLPTDRPSVPRRLVLAASPAQRPPLPRPHQQHSSSSNLPSSVLSVSSSRTSAHCQLHTCSPENVLPLPDPRGSPLPARWLLLLAGDRPWATRHGEETQSLGGPSDKPLPRSPERQHPAGGQAHVRTCSHAQVTLAHACTALPPPTQGVWASGRGCSRITVFGPRGGRLLPGAQVQSAC